MKSKLDEIIDRHPDEFRELLMRQSSSANMFVACSATGSESIHAIQLLMAYAFEAGLKVVRDEGQRCRHGVHGTDCWECYPPEETVVTPPPENKRNLALKPGEKAYLYSSVGKQVVTVLEVGLNIQTPLTPYITTDMVIVQYPNGGHGFAHIKQLERMEIPE